MNKTKIVATIGNELEDKTILKKLMLSGVDVFRFDLTYVSFEFCMEMVNAIKEYREELKNEVAIMIDTNGPCINVGRLSSGITKFMKGDKIRVYVDDILGDETKFSVNYPKLVNEVKYEDFLMINGGKVELKVVDKELNYILCEVEKEGYIKENDRINIPRASLNIPFINRKDKDIILFADKIEADFLALSSIKTSEDILKVNDLLIEIGNDHLELLAKIEKMESLKDIDEIIRVSDGVIVSRSTLGTEIPIEKIPMIQKSIIRKCHRVGKISLVSADFLSSMEKEEVPTRAEVADASTAILDSTDGIILTSSVFTGKYPIETVKMLEKIITSVEASIDYLELLDIAMKSEGEDVTGAIVHSVIDCANRLKVKAIITPTMSGYTAKKMSRFRPSCPIFALSPNIKTTRSLSLNFAVRPVKINEIKSFDEMIEVSKEVARDYLDIKKGDKIIITGGYPFKQIKHTNFMKIEEL